MRVKELVRSVMGDTKDAPIEYRLYLSAIIVGIIVSLFGTLAIIKFTAPPLKAVVG